MAPFAREPLSRQQPPRKKTIMASRGRWLARGQRGIEVGDENLWVIHRALSSAAAAAAAVTYLPGFRLLCSVGSGGR